VRRTLVTAIWHSLYIFLTQIISNIWFYKLMIIWYGEMIFFPLQPQIWKAEASGSRVQVLYQRPTEPQLQSIWTHVSINWTQFWTQILGRKSGRTRPKSGHIWTHASRIRTHVDACVQKSGRTWTHLDSCHIGCVQVASKLCPNASKRIIATCWLSSTYECISAG
jgi:hypothetical protein